MNAGLLVVLISGGACHSRDGAHERVDASSEARVDPGALVDRAATLTTPTGADAGPAHASRNAGSTAIDALGTIYPRDLAPHPIAARVCDVLHGVAARRRAECCGGEPSAILMTECVRVLGATLHAATVDLDEGALDRCATAMNDARAGCDWVTPNAPPLPDACQGLLRGKLERGGVCRSSLECAGDLHCEGVGPTKTGLCTPPGGDGAGCGVHVDVLASYLLERRLAISHPFCAEHCSLVAHKCGPPPEPGVACAANVNCAASQLCVRGRCSTAPPAARGEACGDVPCARGLRCVEGACAALAGSGEACRSDVDCAAGACVRGADGSSQCGAQCSVTMDALRRRDVGPTLVLPRKPALESGKR